MSEMREYVVSSPLWRNPITVRATGTLEALVAASRATVWTREDWDAGTDESGPHPLTFEQACAEARLASA